MGVTGDRVGHEIWLTEPLGNPGSCRADMNELLFELYQVEGVGMLLHIVFVVSQQQKKSWMNIAIQFQNHDLLKLQESSFGCLRLFCLSKSKLQTQFFAYKKTKFLVCQKWPKCAPQPCRNSYKN